MKAINAKEDSKLENYPPVERGTDEYDDLWLRSRLHGYTTYDPNDVRAELEEQAIPLKSIRIPLQTGLSAAWAPNGYGKTFIFNHLHSMGKHSSSHRYANGWDRFRNHYILAQLELDEENRSNPTQIVPYHALGLMVEQGDEEYAVLAIPGTPIERLQLEGFLEEGASLSSSHPIFVRKIQSSEKLDMGDDWTESGWAYSKGNKWVGIADLSDDSEENSVNPHLRSIANAAMQEFSEYNVLYHETPSESEKDRFDGFLESMKPTLQQNRSAFMTDTYARWSSGEQLRMPKLIKNDDVDATTVIQFLEVLHDELLLLTDSMTLQSIAFELDSRVKDFRHYIQHPYVWKRIQTSSVPETPPENLNSAAKNLRGDLLNLMENHESLWSNTLWNVIKDHKNSIARGAASWNKWNRELDLSFHDRLLDLTPHARTTSVLDMLSISYTEKTIAGKTHIALLSEQQDWSVFADVLSRLNRVLFSWGDFNNDLRVEAIHALEANLKQKSEEIHDFGLSSLIDVFLLEYDLQVHQSGSFERLLNKGGHSRLMGLIHSDSNYQQYRGFSIARRMVQSVSQNAENFHEIQQQILGNEDLSSIFYQDEVLRTAEDFQKLATSAIERGFDALNAHMQSTGSVEKITSSPEWPLFFDNSIQKQDVEFEHGVFNALKNERVGVRTMSDDESPFYQEIDAVPLTLSCDFFPTLSATGINPFFLEEEINRCLMPEGAKNSPWGVQVSFPLHQSSDVPTPCVLFHPASVDTNTVRPEHLSFGMRSEICLQLVLSRFLHANRQRFTENRRGVHMLVVDEPEIGRAERWVRLLIERFNRLEKQLNSLDAPGSVLIVSHRNVVAERSTALGQYHIMQKVPDEVEWFDH